ncbi:serralysin [Rhizobium sp. SG_E_25_P2]|uniref:calcium-binding protein n=1 Tax=Rhizobium sp. SG_E_25_P2 TaxID=2879942 RepID=UPI00247549F4|nr:calcium-binding protein [Rhizobium sp. SG_E_25_P2]MDH6267109.1 serralysin [Rhizobium sp. SG_E_25_P2]
MGKTINGTNKADRIEQGSDPAIRVFAKDGNDTIILNLSDDRGGGNFVDAGSGNDGVVNHKEEGNDIRLGAGADTYVGLGFASFATDAGDLVRAGGGADQIAVSTFKSRYFGEAGNDDFFSEGWANVFNGGAGVDTISYRPRSDDPSLGGIALSLAQGIAQTGANRQESLVGIENAEGTNSSDTLIGSAGSNTLKGLANGDSLDGLAGNDILVGGGDADFLIGGSGADRFVFASVTDSRNNGAFDVIGDFSRGQNDEIDLSAIDANTGQSGNQSFRFIGSGDFSGAVGQLRFEDGFVLGDVNGDRRADIAIELDGVSGMASGDFIL